MGRLKTYLAGPISSGNLQHNIDQARAASQALIQAGFAPFCPQLTAFLAGNEPSTMSEITHEVWMEVDIPWVLASDAVLRLPGESRGADIEVHAAQQADIPVYYSVEGLVADPPASWPE